MLVEFHCFYFVKNEDCPEMIPRPPPSPRPGKKQCNEADKSKKTTCGVNFMYIETK